MAVPHGFTFSQVTALCAAATAGILHAGAMGLRKHYGQGCVAYWMRPAWWLGAVSDFMAGLLFTASSPLVAVQILLPVVATCQMSAGYVLGISCFKEPSSPRGRLGLCLAVAGVMVLASSGAGEAGSLSGTEFWKRWIDTTFLLVVSFWMTLLGLVFYSGERSSGFALLSAFFDGFQFLGTRMIATAVEQHGSLQTSADCAAFFLKATCVFLVVHFQQMALHGDMSRVGALLPGFQNLMCGSMGAAFYGDAIMVCPRLVSAAFSTAFGLWLISKRTPIVVDLDPDVELVSTQSVQPTDEKSQPVKRGSAPPGPLVRCDEDKTTTKEMC